VPQRTAATAKGRVVLPAIEQARFVLRATRSGTFVLLGDCSPTTQVRRNVERGIRRQNAPTAKVPVEEPAARAVGRGTRVLLMDGIGNESIGRVQRCRCIRCRAARFALRRAVSRTRSRAPLGVPRRFRCFATPHVASPVGVILFVICSAYGGASHPRQRRPQNHSRLDSGGPSDSIHGAWLRR
jgi:hypothetical protein